MDVLQARRPFLHLGTSVLQARRPFLHLGMSILLAGRPFLHSGMDVLLARWPLFISGRLPKKIIEYHGNSEDRSQRVDREYSTSVRERADQ